MTYRGRFRGPREHLNPLGVPMAAEVLIEIHPIGKRPVRWRARYLSEDGRPTPGGQIRWESHSPIEAPQPAMVKQYLARLFEEQVSEWVSELSEDDKRAERMR